MPKMINKSLPEYAGRVLSKGEKFDVEQEHVAVLLELGLVEAEAVAGEPSEYRTRDMAAEQPQAKRGYKRKAA